MCTLTFQPFHGQMSAILAMEDAYLSLTVEFKNIKTVVLEYIHSEHVRRSIVFTLANIDWCCSD